MDKQYNPEAKGFKKIIRDVFRRTSADKTMRDNLQLSLQDIEGRENEQRAVLLKRQQSDLKALEAKQEHQHERQHGHLSKARDTKQAEWNRRTEQGTWKEKVKKVDLQPTEGQAKILEDRGHDPREYNRVTATKFIEKIARDEGWESIRQESKKTVEPAFTPKVAPEVKQSDAPYFETTAHIKPKFEPQAQGKKKVEQTPARKLKRDLAPSPAPSPFGKSSRPRVKPPSPVTETDKPSLADLKAAPSEKPELGRHGDLAKPWRRTSLSNDNERPWRRDDGPRRERKPSPSPEGGGNDGGGKE